MQNAKLVSTPFSVGCMLSFEQCSGTKAKSEDISQVPYSSAVGPNITQAMGVVSKYMEQEELIGLL